MAKYCDSCEQNIAKHIAPDDENRDVLLAEQAQLLLCAQCRLKCVCCREKHMQMRCFVCNCYMCDDCACTWGPRHVCRSCHDDQLTAAIRIGRGNIEYSSAMLTKLACTCCASHLRIRHKDWIVIPRRREYLRACSCSCNRDIVMLQCIRQSDRHALPNNV